jgi:hypothetical protein
MGGGANCLHVCGAGVRCVTRTAAPFDNDTIDLEVPSLDTIAIASVGADGLVLVTRATRQT